MLPRLPLGPHTRFSEVTARVAVRLIQLDYRHNPQAYSYRPSGILALAERHRRDGIGSLYFLLVSAAKHVQQGATLEQWRSWAMSADVTSLRAIHKRPFRSYR